MIEAAESSIILLEAIITRLSKKSTSSELTSDAADILAYRLRNFQSTLMRTKTLDKRMSNVIELSFNLHTQDAYTQTLDLKLDSRAMKGIAAMTLVFLPMTGIASVFSTPFFQTDVEARYIRATQDFWIFWAFAIPLTFTVVLIYRLWYTWDSVSATRGWKRAWAICLPHVRRKRLVTVKMQRRDRMTFRLGDLERGVVETI